MKQEENNSFNYKSPELQAIYDKFNQELVEVRTPAQELQFQFWYALATNSFVIWANLVTFELHIHTSVDNLNLSLGRRFLIGHVRYYCTGSWPEDFTEFLRSVTED